MYIMYTIFLFHILYFVKFMLYSYAILCKAKMHKNTIRLYKYDSNFILHKYLKTTDTLF